tara:strand:- start:49 stop:1428 length:1380 start_codon:yes stop_codon:yes gene_type:complete
MGAVIEVEYFNTFLLKKSNNGNNPVWNGSTGIPSSLGGYPVVSNSEPSHSYVVEESRIRGGYNNVATVNGVKAYLVEDHPKSSIRDNSLIYSGIFNSRTDINDTNVFSVGEEITKSADPANGSIQKLYAEDTNLIILQEAKVSRALIDKDAIYSAEGGGTITNVNTTIGTIQPYAGNFGISRDPGSFAVYGYRKYFTDRDRNAVLRLSMDGLTEISDYGMYDYFRDNFNDINSGETSGVVTGGWDIYNKQYVLSTKPGIGNGSYNTLSFDERVLGWVSFFNYNPDHVLSVRGSYYSLKDSSLWLHYDNNSVRNRFYGATTPSTITFVFNPSVSMNKVFNTINYEGSNGWKVDSFATDEHSETSLASIGDTAASIYSYDEGAYIENGVKYRVGFNRKENKYHANIINASLPYQDEVLWGNSVTGVKGFFATVKVSTDNTTNPGGAKELFAVSSNYVESSY